MGTPRESSGGGVPAEVKYPTRQPEFSCILTRHQPALFPAKEEPLGYMQFFGLMSNLRVVVQEISDEGTYMEFDLLDAEPCIVNSVRRCLLSDVPSMAPETVFMMQNTSILTDDNIGSRVGLVPFRMDARRYKFRPLSHGVVERSEHADFAAIFDLTIAPMKVPPSSRGTIAKNVNVYSGDLKWLRHSLFPRDLPEKHIPRPVTDKILLATLLPTQEMMLRVHAVKGIGKDHAKFSPVSTAFYRPIPDVRLLRSLYGEQALRLQSVMPKGVIAVRKGSGNEQEAVVANSRLYTTNRRVFTDPDLASAVQISFRENEFMFNVESVGAVSSAALVSEAIRLLKDRCHYLHMICPKESRYSNIKAEDNPHVLSLCACVK